MIDAAIGDDIRTWIAEVTGAEAVEARLTVTGGRLGYMVDATKSGAPLPLFLQRGRESGLGSFQPFAKEAEVFRALHEIGVKVPRVWGVSEELNVLLVERIDGAVWFQEPRDPAEQVSIAKDYIVQLARWHSVPASEMDLPSFAPVRSARAHQIDQLAGIRKVFDEADAEAPIDRLAHELLGFLERALPAYDGPAVLCQGDTGPGNFLYKDGLVSGVLDWELAHLGDPMDDIAWLSWRATQHGFPDFPARIREYEALSGNPVDQARVDYYRVNALARLGPWFGLPDMGQARRARPGVTEGDDNERDASGAQMITTMLHRRMYLTALGKVLGYEPGSRAIEADAVPLEHAGLYDNVLRQLQVMTPLIADRKASNLARGVARQIKYLKEADRNAKGFADAEAADIGRLLGRAIASPAEGRPLLAEAARAGKVGLEGYFDYHWRRMTRDDHLMRTASGKLFERGWPALA